MWISPQPRHTPTVGGLAMAQQAKYRNSEALAVSSATALRRLCEALLFYFVWVFLKKT